MLSHFPILLYWQIVAAFLAQFFDISLSAVYSFKFWKNQNVQSCPKSVLKLVEGDVRIDFNELFTHIIYNFWWLLSHVFGNGCGDNVH